jgi:hypothetical protein
MPILSGLVVSVDAFFIGLSLGLQKKCKFAHLAAINALLFLLCVLGFFLAGKIYERIPFDPDVIVGVSFIVLGMVVILQYLKSRKDMGEGNIVVVGAVMSGEAMLITMGITFIFGAYIVIPVTVAAAHFAYSALTFWFARSRFVRRVPPAVGHVISGLALVAYGIFALI